jgi:hypothetical protein
MNKIDPSGKNNQSGDQISFVTVFTIYKSDPLNEKMLDKTTVGETSYNSKSERSLAILNTYINFIQVNKLIITYVILYEESCSLDICLH